MLLQQILEQEEANNPLSDSEIAEQLKELGVNIKRRTVAFYRQEMQIDNFENRKKHA
jgi:RNA polymerase sigma-54 factor